MNTRQPSAAERTAKASCAAVAMLIGVVLIAHALMRAGIIHG